MSAPRIEIRLDRIRHNARTLVERLGNRGVAVCGVTKVTLGSPEVARALLSGGVGSLGESRIENVETLRDAGITAEIMLIRSPMMSQVDRVVASADISLNSEITVIESLSREAERQGKTHGVVLMVELGDLREGIMPSDVLAAVRCVLDLPGVALRGIGTNLACQSGVIPDEFNMAELSGLATLIESTFGLDLNIVSGGNSANLGWALGPHADMGRINHLRLGESLLLGRDPVRRSAIEGLDVTAISLVGEVIESKRKPSQPRGSRGQTAFGLGGDRSDAQGEVRQVIVALGRQDIDPDGIEAPDGFELLGASSDHLVLASAFPPPAVGTEIHFSPDYSVLLRAMTSPFVARRYLDASDKPAQAA